MLDEPKKVFEISLQLNLSWERRNCDKSLLEVMKIMRRSQKVQFFTHKALWYHLKYPTNSNSLFQIPHRGNRNHGREKLSRNIVQNETCDGPQNGQFGEILLRQSTLLPDYLRRFGIFRLNRNESFKRKNTYLSLSLLLNFNIFH